jgi:sec-independent protein translocase protein TatA
MSSSSWFAAVTAKEQPSARAAKPTRLRRVCQPGEQRDVPAPADCETLIQPSGQVPNPGRLVVVIMRGRSCVEKEETVFTGLEQPTHILMILVLAFLLFGAKRLPEIGRSLGTGLREFKHSISGETPPTAIDGDSETLSAGREDSH